jgi:23S rRNA (adenine2503-C2)-methyltransferase
MTGTLENLLGKSREELAAYVLTLGERPYRGDQIFFWLYGRGATSFDAMTDVARPFRERLASVAGLRGVSLLGTHVSPADGTTKYLFGLEDGLRVESVLIPPATGFEADDPDEEAGTPLPRERLTLCVSTQVGCPLDCAFCATGTMGYLRNLTAGEILDQVLTVRRSTGKTITNVVFMGMGEPMINYDAVMQAAGILTEGIGIAARRITISTAGWADGIRRMGEEKRRMKLAISLHSAVDDTRKTLMPVARRFPLPVLLDAVTSYYGNVRRRITYEVVLFDGINDTPEEIRRLIRFARAVPSKLNLIPYHAITFTHPDSPGAMLRPSPRLQEVVAQLREAHLTVMVRSSAGEDIAAACGQLAVASSPGRTQRAPDGLNANQDPSLI